MVATVLISIDESCMVIVMVMMVVGILVIVMVTLVVVMGGKSVNQRLCLL